MVYCSKCSGNITVCWSFIRLTKKSFGEISSFDIIFQRKESSVNRSIVLVPVGRTRKTNHYCAKGLSSRVGCFLGRNASSSRPSNQ